MTENMRVFAILGSVVFWVSATYIGYRSYLYLEKQKTVFSRLSLLLASMLPLALLLVDYVHFDGAFTFNKLAEEFTKNKNGDFFELAASFIVTALSFCLAWLMTNFWSCIFFASIIKSYNYVVHEKGQ